MIDDVRLTALLKNGILNVNPLELHFGQGAAEIVATVNANARSLALKINTKDIVLQNIHKEFRVDNSSDFGIVAGGESVLSADLNGRGDTYRALVNSLSGHMVVIVDKSTLQTGRFSWLANGFVSQLLNVLRIDTQKAEKIDLKCAVVRADIRNGKVNFPKGIAIDSEKLTVVSGGTLNLQNDKLKLSLNAHRNGLDGIGIVQALSNLIEIGGTLQNPKVVLDKSGALRTIAGVAAGPAYAGVGLLLDRDSAPCYTALKGTAWQTRFPKPSGVSGAAQNAYDGVSGAAQNAYDGVSGAAQNAYDGVSGMASQGAEATKDAAKAFGNGARNLINNFLK